MTRVDFNSAKSPLAVRESILGYILLSAVCTVKKKMAKAKCLLFQKGSKTSLFMCLLLRAIPGESRIALAQIVDSGEQTDPSSDTLMHTHTYATQNNKSVLICHTHDHSIQSAMELHRKVLTKVYLNINGNISARQLFHCCRLSVNLFRTEA